MLFAGGAQSAWGHGLLRLGERVRGTPASCAESEASDRAGAGEFLVGEVGQRDHVVHTRPVTQGAHFDLDLGG